MDVRVYFPASPELVQQLIDGATIAAAALPANAVTPALRAAMPGSADEEDAEYVAFADAMRSQPTDGVARRCVLAADLPEGAITALKAVRDSSKADTSRALSMVIADAALSRGNVVSAHVDETALPASEGGPTDLADLADVLWFDVTELESALDQLIAPPQP